MIKINCLQSITKKITCIALGIIITTNVMVAGNGPKVDGGSSSHSSAFLMGFGFGVRMLAKEGSDVYFENKKVDVGSLFPLAISLFGQYQTKKGITGQISIEGFVAKPGGAMINLAVGYRFFDGKVAVVPLIGVGIANAKTKLEEFALANNEIVIDGNVFIGPTAINDNRGKGSDITLNIADSWINIKPAVQFQFQGSGVNIFAEIGYNLVANSKSKITLEGKGYSSVDEYLTSQSQPETVTIEGELEQIITDIEKMPINTYPLKFNGLNLQLGLIFNLSR